MSMPPRIYTAVKAALDACTSPLGMNHGELKAATGIHRHSLTMALLNMSKAGRIAGYGVNRDRRYFASPEVLAANKEAVDAFFVEQKRARVAAAKAKRSARRSIADKAKRAERRAENTRKRSGLAEILIEASKRPDGFATDEIVGHEPKAVSNAAQYLTRDGRLFRAKGTSGRGGGAVRYFDTPERAQKCKPVPKYKPQKPRPSRATAKPANVTVRNHGRAWWDDSAEPVITANTKVTIAPTPPAPTRTNTHAL